MPQKALTSSFHFCSHCRQNTSQKISQQIFAAKNFFSTIVHFLFTSAVTQLHFINLLTFRQKFFIYFSNSWRLKKRHVEKNWKHVLNQLKTWNKPKMRWKIYISNVYLSCTKSLEPHENSWKDLGNIHEQPNKKLLK